MKVDYVNFSNPFLSNDKFVIILCMDKKSDQKVTWQDLLKDELEKPYMRTLKQFTLLEEESGFEVYPPRNEIFNAFKLTSYDQVKVVIMGQDPYHGKGQAHGLSFSVAKGVKIPPSLQNIYKEIENDLGIKNETHGCLESWAKQGVLLLNATLTVRAKSPKSHYGKGWEIFTDFVVKKLFEREKPMIFMLWGKSAYEKVENVIHSNPKHHLVLTSSHPSPYSAYNGFFGCKHFSKANDFLIQKNQEPINWQIID